MKINPSLQHLLTCYSDYFSIIFEQIDLPKDSGLKFKIHFESPHPKSKEPHYFGICLEKSSSLIYRNAWEQNINDSLKEEKIKIAIEEMEQKLSFDIFDMILTDVLADHISSFSVNDLKKELIVFKEKCYYGYYDELEYAYDTKVINVSSLQNILVKHKILNEEHYLKLAYDYASLTHELESKQKKSIKLMK